MCTSNFLRYFWIIFVHFFLTFLISCGGSGNHGDSTPSSENSESVAIKVLPDEQALIAADIEGNYIVNKYDEKVISLILSDTLESLVIYYNDNLLPTRLIFNNCVVLFDNWTSNTVDIAIISPDRPYSIIRGIPLDYDFIAALDNIKNASVQTSPISMSAFSAPDPTSYEETAKAFKITSKIVSGAICTGTVAASIVSSGITVPALAAACASTVLTFVEVASGWEWVGMANDAWGLIKCSDIRCITTVLSLSGKAIEQAGIIQEDVKSFVDNAQDELSQQSTTLYTISGTVTFNGSGLSGVNVMLSGSHSRSMLTGSSGRYTFVNVVNGTYTLTTRLSGYSFSPSSITIQVNDRNVAVQDIIAMASNNPVIAQTPMRGPSGTSFIQWGSGFTPSSTAILHFLKPDGTEYPAESQSIDNNGTFSITYVSPIDKPAGTYSWWAVDSSGKVSNTISYIIEAPVTYSISGTIYDLYNYEYFSDQAVLSGATISIAGITTTTNMGVFSITGIPAGTYELSISRPHFYKYIDSSFHIASNQNNLEFFLTKLPPYGAIAQNFTTGSCGLSWGYSTVDLAEQSALQSCGVGCSIVGFYGYGQCAAFARCNYGFNYGLGGASGDTLEKAESKALSLCSEYCPGCEVILRGCNESIPGDINEDCIVDIFDFSLLSANYGQTDCGNSADLNGDCIVDMSDEGILRENYGRSCTD